MVFNVESGTFEKKGMRELLFFKGIYVTLNGARIWAAFIFQHYVGNIIEENVKRVNYNSVFITYFYCVI